jgi:hypothetical protein
MNSTPTTTSTTTPLGKIQKLSKPRTPAESDQFYKELAENWDIDLTKPVGHDPQSAKTK